MLQLIKRVNMCFLQQCMLTLDLNNENRPTDDKVLYLNLLLEWLSLSKLPKCGCFDEKSLFGVGIYTEVKYSLYKH